MMRTENEMNNRDDGGDGIDPECRCPVCYEWLEAPVTFECNHSICLGCLQQMLDSAYCKGVCPMCRHRVLNFIRRNAKNPAAMVNQPLAARIAQKRAEGARSTRRPVTPPSTSCKVLRNRIVNTEQPLPKKRKIEQVTGGEGVEVGNGCDGPSATKRRAVGGGSNRSVNAATSSSEPKGLATVGNARAGIPRWICSGCGKIYSIQSKRSWTNHMIACTGDIPPPVNKRKRRGA
ncbi:hypothetical protein SeLEV6574_g07422 [Synchytrium endobioticum]|uniref:RING-type E3 ubiquitin transferase n=1 Tax=Synchytrium endobioticum TaxID=286115 RepID=A0A507CHT1_9FUNG|nr:hypothetical protein SeLEV6574_g07422 [Synchytrium endobioticum]